MVDRPDHPSAEEPRARREAVEAVLLQITNRLRALAGRAQAQGRSAVQKSSKQLHKHTHQIKTQIGPRVADASRDIAGQTGEAGKALGDLTRSHLMPPLSRFWENLRQRTKPTVLKEDYRRILMFIHETILDREIERVLFVPTRDHIKLSELSIRSLMRLSGHDYRPTPSKVFDWAMSSIVDDHKRSIFVDIGAGRGRVLLMASHYDFDKVVGVEFAEELHSDCLMNIAQYPRSRMSCRDVECELDDATHFEIPEQGAVYYFFDPFEPQILEEVLMRIARAHGQHQKLCHLVFVEPPDPALMRRWSMFEPVVLDRLLALKIKLFSPYDIAIYRTRS